jgi:7-cyano-7-deazaguanine reductase
LIESKSLKLFLQSFRNHGAFHEDCIITIGKRLRAAARPCWIRVAGYFAPRGGIPIDVFWQSDPDWPLGVTLPPLDPLPYRARG